MPLHERVSRWRVPRVIHLQDVAKCGRGEQLRRVTRVLHVGDADDRIEDTEVDDSID